MRHLVYSETNITGGKKVEVQLEQPKDEFQDVYVLAFPKNKKEELYLSNKNSSISVRPAVKNANTLLDRNKNTGIEFVSSAYTIDINSKQALTARSITLSPGKTNLIVDCELHAFADGEYVIVKEFNFDRRDFNGQVGPIPYGPLAISFPPVQTDKF